MKKNDIFVRRRIETVAGFLALGLVMLAIRAIDLQWLQKDHLTDLAEKQRYRQFSVVAPRGTISDRNGRILAESIEVPSIAAIADEVPSDRIGDLAKALHLPVADLRRKLAGRSGFVWLARQINPAQAESAMALNIPGIRQESEWRRYHPLGPETGHIIGFVGIDGEGLEGLEHSLDSHLAGEPGIRQVSRDARGRSLPGGVWLRDPVPGKPVRLTVDATIQSIAYAALAEEVRTQHAKGGSVIIMRPTTGDVLALANWPGFNPNNFRQFNPGEWRNRAVTDVFEPGSTLKPFTVAAALTSGRWHADSRIFCENGAMQVADHVIHDDHAEGWLDIPGLLAKSSNIGAAKLALDIGPASLFELLNEAGFGHRSHISIGGESPGIVPPLERWGPVETANIAFGQGIAVTPLQLAAAFSILANDGKLMAPHIRADEATDEVRQVIPASVSHQLLSMLEYATSQDGTGRQAVPVGYRIGGKTGTAQKADSHGEYTKDRFTAVFAGIAPIDNPQIVMVVVIDEPQKSIYGGQVAAPVFRKIAENILPYLGVSPQVEDERAWRTTPVAVDTAALPQSGNLYGMSLREVRNVAGQLGLRLTVHGSGWVSRQSPSSISQLNEGDALEVWLHD